MVDSVVVAPTEARAFKGPSGHDQERHFGDRVRIIRAMRPQSVVTGSDTNATNVEHYEREDNSLQLYANEERRNETQNGGDYKPNGDGPVKFGE